MAAQIHFHFWREPAQIVAVLVRDKERCISQIGFGRDGLHLLIRQPFF